jgi:hypothetical protein
MTELEQLQKEKKVLLDRIASLEQELEKEREYKQKVFDVINKDHALMGLLVVSLHIQNFLDRTKEGDCKCE